MTLPKFDEAQPNQAIERTHWRPVTAAVIATFAAVTPGFTVGALTGSITDDLHINTGILGVGLACFFAFTAIGSLFSARLAERLPPALQLAISTLLAGFVMIGLSRVSLFVLCVVLLSIGGLANSLVQPAVGRILSIVPKRRLSLASGLVQAALGAGTFPAFLLFRYVADPYGWRAAFTVGGTIVVLLTIVVFVLARLNGMNVVLGEPDRTQNLNAPVRLSVQPLYLWTLGAAFGTVGVTGISSFFIPIATYQGFSVTMAASLALAISCLVALTRILAGIIADQRPDSNLVLVIAMMFLGTTGLVLASLHVHSLFLLGLFIVVIGIFGWNGLLVAAALRLLSGSPARILGWLQVGFFTGATLAPIVFGVLMTALGVRWAILTTAACSVVGAFMFMSGEIYRRKDEQNQVILGPNL